jgi:major outer membrane protein
MKKLAALLFSMHALMALPVGNPSDPALLCEGLVLNCLGLECLRPCQLDFLKLQVGYYGDCVFQRNMETYSLPGWQDENKDYLHTSLVTNAGYLSLTFCETLEVFSTFGASKIRLDGDLGAFKMLSNAQWTQFLRPTANPLYPSVGGLLSIETLSSFSWSVGGRGVLLSCGPLKIGAEAQYFSTRLPVKYLNSEYTSLSANGLLQANDLLNMTYSEWQVGLGVSVCAGCFEPYAAIKVSRAHLLMDNARVQLNGPNPQPYPFSPILGNARSAKTWGYAIGNTLKLGQQTLMTVEGRFGDEKALFLNGQLAF